MFVTFGSEEYEMAPTFGAMRELSQLGVDVVSTTMQLGTGGTLTLDTVSGLIYVGIKNGDNRKLSKLDVEKLIYENGVLKCIEPAINYLTALASGGEHIEGKKKASHQKTAKKS